jgi:hypothetical protein
VTGTWGLRPYSTVEKRRGQSHRHHGRFRVLFANAFRQAVKFTDVPPAVQERHPHMPAASYKPANLLDKVLKFLLSVISC